MKESNKQFNQIDANLTETVWKNHHHKQYMTLSEFTHEMFY